MAFVPRTKRPEPRNPYYNRIVNGGYSRAIQGSPTDPGCDVLSNCVGYAYGRFNEIGKWGYCKYLAPVNAENFMRYKGSCEAGMTPRLGACMVWQKGAPNSEDGVGHVAIVEKVISDTEVYTSESDWGGSPFFNRTRKKGSNGRWGAGKDYTFLGFIYNPAVEEDDYMTKDEILKELGDKFIKNIDDAPAYAQPYLEDWCKKQYINGGTSYKDNPRDVNMFLSDINALIIADRIAKGG